MAKLPKPEKAKGAIKDTGTAVLSELKSASKAKSVVKTADKSKGSYPKELQRKTKPVKLPSKTVNKSSPCLDPLRK